MGLFKDYVNQTRKPEGFLGKLMVFGMNGGHAKLADWGMSHLENITPASIAELGCGGGRNAAELMKRYPAAKLTALDYSETSVKKARATNQKAIAAGRCSVLRENVASLAGAGDLLRRGLPDLKARRNVPDLQRIRRHGRNRSEI